jgi:hypothetical protein
LSGWIGYTLVYARQRTYSVNLPSPNPPLGFDSPYQPTLDDQRHTVNAFGSYRLTPSIRVSAKALYGSGFPVAFLLSPALRLGPYERLDLRADKSWSFQRWKLDLYGELLNATNHNNRRFEGLTSDTTGHFGILSSQGLPILPTVGLRFDF